MEIAWTTVSVLVAIFVGVAFTMVGYVPPEYRAARWCFGSAALILGGMSVVWQFETEKPLSVRIIVGVLIWSLIGVGLPEAFRWVKRRELQAHVGSKPTKPSEAAAQFNRIAKEQRDLTDSSKKPTVQYAAKASASSHASPSAPSPVTSAPPIPSKDSPAWPNYIANKHLSEDPRSLTLYDLFLTDFKGSQKIGTKIKFTDNRNGRTVTVEEFAVINLERNTQILEFYIPFRDDTYRIAANLSNDYQRFLSHDVVMSQKGDSDLNSSQTAVFTGVIFIYNESELSAEQVGNLTKSFQDQGAKVQFRSASYLSNRKLQLLVDKKQ